MDAKGVRKKRSSQDEAPVAFSDDLQDSESDSTSSKRAVSMLRMGKRRVGMLRMGRLQQQPEDVTDTEAVRRAVGMLRMGRSGDEQHDKRAVSMLRMGRGQQKDLIDSTRYVKPHGMSWFSCRPMLHV